MTKAVLGGIIISSVAAEATTPIAIPFFTPCLSISGIATLASMATVAAPEPLAAPKAVAPIIVAWMMPPGMPSSQRLASLKPSSAKPARAGKGAHNDKERHHRHGILSYCRKRSTAAIPRALEPPFNIQKPTIAITPMQAETGYPETSITLKMLMAIVPTVVGWT